MKYIQRIDYINLDRSTERNATFLEALEQLGTDMSMVHRYSGYDRRDYASTDDFIGTLGKAYPHFKKAPIYEHRIGEYGLIASAQSVLQRVKESGQISLVCHDDVQLLRPLSDFDALVGKVISDDFKCIQIENCENCEDNPPSVVERMATQRKVCPELYENFRAAGEACLILSPAGAELLLQAMCDCPSEPLEGVIERELIPQNVPGCYSVVNRLGYFNFFAGYSDISAVTKSVYSDRRRIVEFGCGQKSYVDFQEGDVYLTCDPYLDILKNQNNFIYAPNFVTAFEDNIGLSEKSGTFQFTSQNEVENEHKLYWGVGWQSKYHNYKIPPWLRETSRDSGITMKTEKKRIRCLTLDEWLAGYEQYGFLDSIDFMYCNMPIGVKPILEAFSFCVKPKVILISSGDTMDTNLFKEHGYTLIKSGEPFLAVL